jgi:hypothetical protein
MRGAKLGSRFTFHGTSQSTLPPEVLARLGGIAHAPGAAGR